MTVLYTLNADRTVAVDPFVRFYSMATCPKNVKVQLLTDGGVAVYGEISGDKTGYAGWRPVPGTQKG